MSALCAIFIRDVSMDFCIQRALYVTRTIKEYISIHSISLYLEVFFSSNERFVQGHTE
jgi:hypothetical protein